jgi:hypothetical protein
VKTTEKRRARRRAIRSSISSIICDSLRSAVCELGVELHIALVVGTRKRRVLNTVSGKDGVRLNGLFLQNY